MQPHVTWWLGLDRGPSPVNPLLLVVPGDDQAAVSALPEGYAQQWATATVDGRTATARVARHLDVPILLAEDASLPTGHDLLLLAGVGRGMTTAASVIACTHLGAEPQLVTGHGSGIDDIAWMDKVRDIRERRGEPAPPLRLLAEILEQAAAESVPVLLDGVDGAAAAVLVAERPDIQIPALGEEPAHRLLAEHLGCPVWHVSTLPPGAGLSALGALAGLRLGLLAEAD